MTQQAESSPRKSIRSALISVSNKSGLLELATYLQLNKIKIYSTGGTRKYLTDQGIAAEDLSNYTGFPEILDGRVKTLHPKVFGGILARKDEESHQKQLTEHNIDSIDMVVCNLYPFEEVTQKENCDLSTAIENIDIGGPSLLRAAAKNYQHTLVVPDASLYPKIIEEMEKQENCVSNDVRKEMALFTFQRVQQYDQTIASYLETHFTEGQKLSSPKADPFQNTDHWPQQATLNMNSQQSLRYGENPHQNSQLYLDQGVKDHESLSLATMKQLHGKELSYNNLLDINACFEMITEFTDDIVTIIVKHNNPCGMAIHPTSLLASYEKALETDPQSAFGGIVICNQPITLDVAEKLHSRFFEIIAAPSFEDQALEILRKKKNIRLLEVPTAQPLYNQTHYTRVQGGWLVQESNQTLFSGNELKVVTDRFPTDDEKMGINFAWKAVKHVKSNAIVLSTADQLLGVGAGQMSRIDAMKIATSKMHENFPKFKPSNPENPLVLASDAFFPFKDVVEMAAEIGVTTIIQPGGSIRDEESVTEANKHNIAMVFTKTRQFKH